MTDIILREAREADRALIRALEEDAFARTDEARLVERLVEEGDDILELVAERDGRIVGHLLFSRLTIETPHRSFHAVALAPLAVATPFRRQGVGAALVEEAHDRLRLAGERLAVVLGDPAYYGRFGYRHARAARFSSDYQGPELQALAWGDAPASGRLVYASAFGDL